MTNSPTNRTFSLIDLLELAALTRELDRKTLHSLSALPPRTQYEAELNLLGQLTSSPALSILDPLVPSTSSGSSSTRKPLAYDSQGYSAHARIRIALLELVGSDRRLTQENTWIIPQLLILEILTRDFVALPGYLSPFFSLHRAEKTSHEWIMKRSQQALTYALSSLGADLSLDWHKALTVALRNSKTRRVEDVGLGPLANIVASSFWASLEENAVISTRLFYSLLRGILRESVVEVGDLWLALAQSYLESGKYHQVHVDYKSTCLLTPYDNQRHMSLLQSFAAAPV